MALHRFALLDAAGVCINVVQYELPWIVNYASLPSVRYIVSLEGTVDLPEYLGRDWELIEANGRVSPGDSVNITTGEVTYKTPPVAPPPTKAELRSRAAEKRWEVEVGGTVWNGWPVATDRESQNKVMGEFIGIMAGIRNGGGWKFADGVFRPLSNQEAQAMGLAVRAHIAAAFMTEAALIAGIDAGNITNFAQIEAADWPTNA